MAPLPAAGAVLVCCGVATAFEFTPLRRAPTRKEGAEGFGAWGEASPGARTRARTGWSNRPQRGWLQARPPAFPPSAARGDWLGPPGETAAKPGEASDSEAGSAEGGPPSEAASVFEAESAEGGPPSKAASVSEAESAEVGFSDLKRMYDEKAAGLTQAQRQIQEMSLHMHDLIGQMATLQRAVEQGQGAASEQERGPGGAVGPQAAYPQYPNMPPGALPGVYGASGVGQEPNEVTKQSWDGDAEAVDQMPEMGTPRNEGRQEGPRESMRLGAAAGDQRTEPEGSLHAFRAITAPEAAGQRLETARPRYEGSPEGPGLSIILEAAASGQRRAFEDKVSRQGKELSELSQKYLALEKENVRLLSSCAAAKKKDTAARKQLQAREAQLGKIEHALAAWEQKVRMQAADVERKRGEAEASMAEVERKRGEAEASMAEVARNEEYAMHLGELIGVLQSEQQHQAEGELEKVKRLHRQAEGAPPP